MDRPFIKTMCTAYHSDFELLDTSIWESIDDGTNELVNHIKSIVETLKLEDIQLYEELFELSRQKQYTLVYNLLDEYMSETYSDAMPKEDPIYNDDEMLEMFGSLAGSTILGMTGVAGIGVFLTALLLFTDNRVTRLGNKIHAKAATIIYNMTDKISASIKSASLPGKVKNAMIYKNVGTMCGAECRIPKGSKISTHITNMISGSGATDEINTDIFKCLSNCYFSHILSGVEFISRQYAACLMASGEDLPMGKGPTILTTVLKTPIGEHCKSYFDTLNELHSDWTQALAVICKDDPRKRQEYTVKFLNAIEKGLHSNTRQFGGPPRKPKPNKQYGQNRR